MQLYRFAFAALLTAVIALSAGYINQRELRTAAQQRQKELTALLNESQVRRRSAEAHFKQADSMYLREFKYSVALNEEYDSLRAENAALKARLAQAEARATKGKE